MEGGRRGKVPGWLHIRKKSGHLVRRAPLASRSCCCACWGLRGSQAALHRTLRPQPHQEPPPRAGLGRRDERAGAPPPAHRCRCPVARWGPGEPRSSPSAQPASSCCCQRATGVACGCVGTCCLTTHRYRPRKWETGIFSTP